MTWKRVRKSADALDDAAVAAINYVYMFTGAAIGTGQARWGLAALAVWVGRLLIVARLERVRAALRDHHEAKR